MLIKSQHGYGESMKQAVLTFFFRILFVTGKLKKTSNATTACVCLTSQKGNFLRCVAFIFLLGFGGISFKPVKEYNVDNNWVDHTAVLTWTVSSSFRWFWHFYAISVGWNSFLLVLNLKSIFQQQSYPSWLTGILDMFTGVPSTHSQGRLKVHCCVNACVPGWYSCYL